jgi:tetrahydromethanopterin S-methyltransferase subunit F
MERQSRKRIAIAGLATGAVLAILLAVCILLLFLATASAE